MRGQDPWLGVCVNSAFIPREGDYLTFNASDLIMIRGLKEEGWTEESLRPFLGKYVVGEIEHEVVMGDLWRLESRVTVEAIKEEK